MPDVVTIIRVLRPRISQADDKPLIPCFLHASTVPTSRTTN